jgi:hypothetical protein
MFSPIDEYEKFTFTKSKFFVLVNRRNQGKKEVLSPFEGERADR